MRWILPKKRLVKTSIFASFKIVLHFNGRLLQELGGQTYKDKFD